MHILHLNQRNQILFRYLRDKGKKKEESWEKKGGGGENSPISPPLDPRLIVPVNPRKNRVTSELLYTQRIRKRGLQILLVFYQHPEWFISL